MDVLTEVWFMWSVIFRSCIFRASKIRIDVNRFCDITDVANEFTNFTAQTTAYPIADTISRQFKVFTYKFRINILRILRQFFPSYV